MSSMLTPDIEQRMTALITEMVQGRRPGATIGPADVARRFDDQGWKRWMDSVKEVARRMAAAGTIEVTRHGAPVEGWPWRGVIRFRARADASASQA
jgi:hypothetical protein